MWFEPSILLKEMKSSVWNFFKFKGTKIKGPNKSTGMESFLDEKIKKKDEEELSDKNVNDSSGEEEYLVIEQFKNSEAINDALRDIKFKKK